MCYSASELQTRDWYPAVPENYCWMTGPGKLNCTALKEKIRAPPGNAGCCTVEHNMPTPGSEVSFLLFGYCISKGMSNELRNFIVA